MYTMKDKKKKKPISQELRARTHTDKHKHV